MSSTSHFQPITRWTLWTYNTGSRVSQRVRTETQVTGKTDLMEEGGTTGKRFRGGREVRGPVQGRVSFERGGPQKEDIFEDE